MDIPKKKKKRKIRRGPLAVVPDEDEDELLTAEQRAEQKLKMDLKIIDVKLSIIENLRLSV